MFRAMRTLAWCCVFLCIMSILIIGFVHETKANQSGKYFQGVQTQLAATNTQTKTKKTKPGTTGKTPAQPKSTGKTQVKPNPKQSVQVNKPTVTADAAVLVDVITGDVLYDKQAHQKRAPASTTKIMTAILGLELGSPDEVVTVSEKAARVGEATLNLDPGEKITLYELITGALVKSGNDACVAIAEHIAGSEAKFVEIMNQKALILGAKNTHFANTNGLPNKDHYSSAYDLAMFARYGLQLPTFSSITRQKETEIHFLKPDVMMNLRNTNKLLWSYQYADGVKTGTTNAAGKCLVASATKDGRQLVAVVLHAGDRFGDAQKLLNWGFNNTETYTLARAGEVAGEFPMAGIPGIKAILESPVQLSLPNVDKSKVNAKIVWVRQPVLPILPGEILGQYEVWLGEVKLKSVPLLSEQAVERDFLGRVKKLAFS